ncbi:DUF3221 domain-containing protein [Alkalibaculum sp. M08DMB]|uniref:DUF3221 domain-containing protein n=1 Tax=Alkalibaculum sporogenes TaxID=2655001 RepID=A0A6A7KD34_9FIRM|nr:YobA family protein [Alkalibaculum sporogenes]MPW27231.1 DUF3221 domain-containing protein [Alkalibaculum sporogenes]
MKKLYIPLILLLLLSLSGCKGDPGMIGYVIQRENDRILVVDTIAQDFSETGGLDEFYNAIWFANAPEDVNIGDKVKVWFDIVAESYPGQSTVKYIEVVNFEKPSGANLSETEALHKVLTSDENNINQLVAVSSIEYNRDTGKWKIILKDIWNDRGELLEFQVDDQ